MEIGTPQAKSFDQPRKVEKYTSGCVGIQIIYDIQQHKLHDTGETMANRKSKAIGHVNLVDRIVDAVRDSILSGELGP